MIALVRKILQVFERHKLQSLERAAHDVPLLKDNAARLAETLQKIEHDPRARG